MWLGGFRMSTAEIILLALGLAMDAFAVSLVVGAGQHARRLRPAVRLSFHFGLFQCLMPMAGWALGRGVDRWMASFDHWIAFGLLAIVGGRMVYAGLHPQEERHRDDPTRRWNLVSLSVATSIDAFAVGLSLALLRVSIWYPCVLIGLITAGLSVIGVRIGNRVGDHLGGRMEVVGGLILCLIGARILWGGLAAATVTIAPMIPVG